MGDDVGRPGSFAVGQLSVGVHVWCPRPVRCAEGNGP